MSGNTPQPLEPSHNVTSAYTLHADQRNTGQFYNIAMPGQPVDASRQLDSSSHFHPIQPRSTPLPSVVGARAGGSAYEYVPSADQNAYRAFSTSTPSEQLPTYHHLSPLYPDHTRNYQVPEMASGNTSSPQWPQSYSMQYAQSGAYGYEDPRSGSYESVVGKPGYPAPAPTRGPKQRFTDEDDELLRKLKEGYVNPRLSWKQIADFFPDRNSGTLQVRYCTRLKKKDEIRWTEESDRKLIKLLKEDAEGRWKRVAQKMGNGATDQACEARADELNARSLQAQGFGDGD